MSVVAVDVGGTGIKAARLAGTVVEQRLSVPTPAADVPEAVRAAAAALLTDAVDAVGVVVPGVVEDGVVRYSANVNWRDVPLRRLLTEALGLPVAVGHDVTAAGLAEADGGDLFYVSLGTGIGGAVVTGGSLLAGARGIAGEIGHVPVWPDGERCACGQLGCLEAYASAGGLLRRYGAGVDSAAEIVARLGSDARADAVWADATTALGIALAGATLLLDPPRIVLGGGLAQAGEALLAPVRTELARRLAWRPAPPIVGAVHGADAGIRGAALLAGRGREGRR